MLLYYQHRCQYHFCGYYCHRRWQYHFCMWLLVPPPGGNIIFVAIIATAGGNIISVAISATARWQYHFCGFLLTPVFWWQYHRPNDNATLLFANTYVWPALNCAGKDGNSECLIAAGVSTSA